MIRNTNPRSHPARAWICPALLAATCAACLQENPARLGEDTPHVVVYVVDTLRRDRLGTYGYDQPTSPHIDALASEAVVFDRAFAPAPWTLPSVVSMLTSTFPVDHGVLARGDRVGESLIPLSSRLRALGYRTAGFATNPYAGRGSGLNQVYDHFEKMRHTVKVSAVDDWLSTVPGEPVFLYLHSKEPHRPYTAPRSISDRFGTVSPEVRQKIRRGMREYRDLSRIDFDANRPPGTTDNTEAQRKYLEELEAHADAIRILYDSGVAWADENIGNVIDLLRRRDMWDQTLFLLVSDHGEEFFEHGGLLHNQSVYGELVDVPMIWRLPEGSKGIRVTHPATLVDVVPTILDVLGQPCPKTECQGRSLLPFIEGTAPATDDEHIVTSVRWNHMTYYKPFEDSRGDFNVSIVAGRWKGIWNVEHSSLELYDTISDPDEQQNLASQQPELFARLQGAVEAWLAARPKLEEYEPPGGRESLSELDEETLRQLRTLGYVP